MNFSILCILLFVTSALKPFVIFNNNEIKKIIRSDILFTYRQMILNKENKNNYQEWRRKNRNHFECLKVATIKEEKAIYLGWNTNTIEFEKMPAIYCIIDIESTNLININRIVENPRIVLDEDNIKKFNTDLKEIGKNNSIYINIGKLKNYDGGRWYLNLLHIH